MAVSSRISPCLWFDGRALEAASFYVSIFDNSRVLTVSQLTAGPAIGNQFVEFELGGDKFTAIDGGPSFTFSPAISFVVMCDSQDEIDYFWDTLAEEGKPGRCGWLEDKFGVSWQIVPAVLSELMSRAPAKVMEAILSMQKLDIAHLRKAAGLR